jgi:hypothetical protein
MVIIGLKLGKAKFHKKLFLYFFLNLQGENLVMTKFLVPPPAGPPPWNLRVCSVKLLSFFETALQMLQRTLKSARA